MPTSVLLILCSHSSDPAHDTLFPCDSEADVLPFLLHVTYHTEWYQIHLWQYNRHYFLQEVLDNVSVMRLSHIMQLALNPLHRRKIGCGTTTCRYSLSARLMPHIIAVKRQQGLSFHADHGISLV